MSALRGSAASLPPQSGAVAVDCPTLPEIFVEAVLFSPIGTAMAVPMIINMTNRMGIARTNRAFPLLFLWDLTFIRISLILSGAEGCADISSN
jgi:hypothetical protein